MEEAADAALARTAATLQSATAVTTFFMVGLGVVVTYVSNVVVAVPKKLQLVTVVDPPRFKCDGESCRLQCRSVTYGSMTNEHVCNGCIST